MAGKPHIRRECWTREGVRHYTKNYYLNYLDSRGVAISMPLYRDLGASEHVGAIVAEIDKAAEAGLKPEPRLLEAMEALPERTRRHFVKWGLVSKAGAAKTQDIEGLIEKWGAYLTTSQASPKFVVQAVARARRVCRECGFKLLDDIERSAVQQWLFDFVNAGNATGTAETYIRSIRAWCNWLAEEGIIPESPLKRLKGTMRIPSTVKKLRREFTESESEVLLSSALASNDKVRSMHGVDRWHLYTCALGTGLRYGELYSLTVGSFNLAANPATVTVEAGNSKHRRTDVLPLAEPLAAILKEYFAGRDIQERAFRGMLSTRGAEMIHHDLEVAGIPFKTVEGELDFHALRHTFISRLIRAGVNPKIVQVLSRHSTPELTIGRYSHVQMSELAAALNQCGQP